MAQLNRPPRTADTPRRNVAQHLSRTLTSPIQPLSCANARNTPPAPRGPPEKLRDVTFGEDDHLARSGHTAANLAALRNTVISLLHLAGTTQIARTLRRLARNPEHAITLLTSTNPTLN